MCQRDEHGPLLPTPMIVNGFGVFSVTLDEVTVDDDGVAHCTYAEADSDGAVTLTTSCILATGEFI